MDHEQDAVPALLVVGLGVDDEGVVVLPCDQVGGTGQDGGASPQPVGVLLQDGDGVVSGQPLSALVVDDAQPL